MEGRVIGYLGPPGSGKTRLALAHLARLHAAGMRCYIADRMGDAPAVLPDGTRIPLRSTDDLRLLAFRREMARLRSPWIQAFTAPHPELTLLRRVVAWNDLSAVLLDECGQAKDASRHRIGDALSDMLAGRRHGKVTILWGAQYPRQIHYSLISQCDWVYCFGMGDHADLSRLAEAGIPDHEIAEVRRIGTENMGRRERGESLNHSYRRICKVGGDWIDAPRAEGT